MAGEALAGEIPVQTCGPRPPDMSSILTVSGTSSGSRGRPIRACDRPGERVLAP
jgi:hypothetical protein